MKIHVFANDTTFTGGRLVLFHHPTPRRTRARRHHPSPAAACPVEWMDLRVPVRDLDATGYAGLPAADVCLFDRRRFARPLCRAGRGVPVQFCQGFEGVDVDVRIARLAAGPAGWFRLGERWSLWRRRRAIDRDYALPTVKIVVQERLARSPRPPLPPAGLPRPQRPAARRLHPR